MKALVLAAGRSKRMSPVEDKNFLNFLGRTLIERQLAMIYGAGFREIVMIVGAHNVERMRELVNGLDYEVEMVEQEDLEMGMCGAVLSAEKYISGGPVLVFSSNDVVDVSAFESMRKAYDTGEAESYLLGKTVDQYFPGGYLETDEAGFIHNIIEKPGAGNEPSNLVNLVVHVHGNADELIRYLRETSGEADDLYETGMAKMMADGKKYLAVPYEGFWQPIKFPWHVKPVADYFFKNSEKQISDTAQISEKATVKGDVIIEDGVKIFEGAVVNGPAYIGKNSVIANNALVRDSYIGADCVIGYSTEVARSFLGKEVWTHSNYIGDSLIGNNVSFGAGTLTGNLRLDEKEIFVNCSGQKVGSGTNKLGLITGDNIRVGVNTSFMPGCKLGSHSFVGAGIVVPEDILEKSFVRGSWELKISENKGSANSGDRADMKDKLK